MFMFEGKGVSRDDPMHYTNSADWKRYMEDGRIDPNEILEQEAKVGKSLDALNAVLSPEQRNVAGEAVQALMVLTAMHKAIITAAAERLVTPAD